MMHHSNSVCLYCGRHDVDYITKNVTLPFRDKTPYIPAVSNLIHTFLLRFNCNIKNELLSNYALFQ